MLVWRKLSLIVGLLIVLAFPVAARAVLVGAADLVGSRSTPSGSGIVATDGWAAASGGLKVSWSIFLSGTTWTYSYTFSNANGSIPATPDLSHLILEVSPFFTSNQIFNANATVVGPQTFTKDTETPFSGSPSSQTDADNCAGAITASPGNNGGNPCLPADIFGIKLDKELTTYLFDSDKAPVWGDFYTKDGAPDSGPVAVAWNTGFGTDPTSLTTDFTNWIPTPDTENGFPPGGVEVPEGATLLFMGAGVIGLVAIMRRTRRYRVPPS